MVERYAITFGEVAIAHIGGKEFGQTRYEHGFSVDELRELSTHIEGAELVMLSDALPEEMRAENLAAVLVIRNGAGDAKALLQEQRSITYDKLYYDARQKKTKHKRARYNLVFADEGIEHSSDYSQPTVMAFSSLPMLARLRAKIGELFGPKATNLNAEGNYYFNAKSGIGFHGDRERKVVICCSLGTTMNLVYQWRIPRSSETYGPNIEISLASGDIYVMSEKATGWDWLKRSKVRVVHAAGAHASK